MLLKIFYPADNTEKQIGFCSDLQYSVSQGQKAIFTVDSTFPAEIAQAAGPSIVRGTMTLYLPKGSSPEAAGLVPFRTDALGEINHAASKYMHIRLYDRLTSSLLYSLDFTKVSNYTVSVRTRAVVIVQLSFESIYCTPGNS